LLMEHVREQFVVGVMALAVLLNDSFEWLRHDITMYSRSRVNECISLHGNTNVNHLTWLYDRLESCVCQNLYEHRYTLGCMTHLSCSTHYSYQVIKMALQGNNLLMKLITEPSYLSCFSG
jgi:hypothetical protein